jgi:hypothetical protein
VPPREMKCLAAALVAAFFATGPLLAVQMPQPVAPGEEATRPDYRTTGLIEAALSWGSGVVAEHPRVVLSCAHVVYDADYHRWTSGARWYRAYNGTGAPDASTAESLNGYFYWRSYSAAVKKSLSAGGKNVLDALAKEFNLDAVAYFSYADDLGDGEYAEVMERGARQIASPGAKWITGYPAGRYDEGDLLEYRLHVTGRFASPLLRETGSAKNYVTAYSVAETGSGNSGGPVWMEGYDGKPQVAGLLVSGAEQAVTGESFIGVHATSKQSLRLIKSAMATAEKAASVVIQPYDTSPDSPEAIPDALTRRRGNQFVTTPGELALPFRVSGLPRTINQVELDLEIEHEDRADLVVFLQSPDRKRLPVYDGEYEKTEPKFQGRAAPLFYGINPNGRWVLRILDYSPAKTGRLVSGRVHITAR